MTFFLFFFFFPPCLNRACPTGWKAYRYPEVLTSEGALFKDLWEPKKARRWDVIGSDTPNIFNETDSHSLRVAHISFVLCFKVDFLWNSLKSAFLLRIYTVLVFYNIWSWKQCMRCRGSELLLYCLKSLQNKSWHFDIEMSEGLANEKQKWKHKSFI